MPSLALPSVPASVSEAVDAAEAAVREASFSHEMLGRVSLAVAEAVANAIEHGNAGDDSALVRVDLRTESGSLTISVCDGGRGVKASSVSNAELPDDPFQTHGRGLYLIRVLSDHCRVEGGCLHLQFHERDA